MTISLRSVQQSICIALLVFSAPACSSSYRGAAIEGRVVDAETKQPVKDVVVVIEWQLYGGFWHGDLLGRLLLQETVTDVEGRYRFPAWGPLRGEKGDIDHASPVLNFYKRGYKFTVLRNHGYPDPAEKLPDPLISEWDGKTIDLEPHTGNLDRKGYYEEMGECCHLYSLDDVKCAWQQMPRMTAVLMKRRLEYLDKGESTSLPYKERLYRTGQCADPEKVLREYLNE